MERRNYHSALRIEPCIKQYLPGGPPGSSPTAELVTVRSQWGKDDTGYSLHIAPLKRTSSGIQRTDFLHLLGFERASCQFVNGQQCNVRWVASNFHQETFWNSFERAYSAMLIAQQELDACGMFLLQPKGLRSDLPFRIRDLGDGHTAPNSELIRKAQDDQFQFAYSLFETPDLRGWVTHYYPRHRPLSPELQAAMLFLGLQPFENCPQFDFEECYWRFTPFRKLGAVFVTPNGGTTSNSIFVQKNFESHAPRFSVGLEALLRANSTVEPYGMGFLEMPEQPHERVEREIKQRTSVPKERKSGTHHEFDVAISVASTERPYAEQLAAQVKDAGFSVFYDEFYPEMLWGKNLVEFFDEIYRKRSARCVMFISPEYEKRMWTIHERRSAQARALEERGQEYLLPIKVGNVELPGMPPTTGYLELGKYGIDKIADILINKLQSLRG